MKDSFSEFGNDKITKLSASLAYYTGFSLAPLLVLIIAICGVVFGQEAVQGNLQSQISGLIGADAAAQVQDMIKNASLTGKSTMATVISGGVLLISATTIFGEIQDSINSIWGLRLKSSAGLKNTIMNRLLSFGVIASLGFILLVSLVATSDLEGLGERLQQVFPQVSFVLLYVINMALTLVVVSMIFAVIFKVLPDADIQWKAVMPGAVATAILFMIGKIAISFYISKSDMGSSFGAASSLAVIFVWIYYSSIILYFGAEFTKAYAVNKGYRVTPDKHAEWDENARTVPGAKPKTTPVAPSRSHHEVRPTPQGYPQLAIASHPIANRNLPAPAPVRDIRREGPRGDASSSTTKKPGMGTALLGLALYFITKGSDKKKSN